MTALHLLHRHHEPHLPLQSVSAGWFWRELVPSSVAAIRSRTADTESLRIERVGVMESLRLERVEPVRSTESQQAFCAGAKPENKQHLRAKPRAQPDDAPEVRKILEPTGYSSLPIGTACTAYLETQAYFHKPQGHAPQFWYCETCKMGMIHSCPPDSAAPRPSGSCYDHGSLGLNSSALEFKGCKPASKSYDNELCTLSKLRSSPLLSWMAACCLIGASALAL